MRVSERNSYLDIGLSINVQFSHKDMTDGDHIALDLQLQELRDLGLGNENRCNLTYVCRNWKKPLTKQFRVTKTTNNDQL